MLYSSFKCVRSFKFCASPLVKRYNERSETTCGSGKWVMHIYIS